MALAHHMMVVVYQVLSRKEEYVEFGGDYYDRRDKPRTVARLVARLARLGYHVDLKEREGEARGEPEVYTLIEAPVTASEVEANRPKRRRGRPCKCAERGIVCRHQGAGELISLIPQPSAPA